MISGGGGVVSWRERLLLVVIQDEGITIFSTSWNASEENKKTIITEIIVILAGTDLLYNVCESRNNWALKLNNTIIIPFYWGRVNLSEKCVVQQVAYFRQTRSKPTVVTVTCMPDTNEECFHGNEKRLVSSMSSGSRPNHVDDVEEAISAFQVSETLCWLCQTWLRLILCNTGLP